MNEYRIGSLCSGAGGLDMAVEHVFGAQTTWHTETDTAASTVLANRYPETPNLGDIATTDWADAEPVDILCAGWPCQPFSLAGKRKGINDERAIWPHVEAAIRTLRPKIVVLENVPGILRHEFGRVANTLAQNGYDFSWICLRASEVGAPHRRERVFIVAHADGSTIRQSTSGAFEEEAGTQTSDGFGNNRGERPTRNGWANRPVKLLPTPVVTDAAGTRNMTAGRSNPDSKHHSGTTLTDAITLLPTPTTADGNGSRKTRGGDRNDELLLAGIAIQPSWGKYEAAVKNWERLTTTAPNPTEPNTKGNPRLSPRFSEWMMGWPEGWVTDLINPERNRPVDTISRNDALRIIGNGVVPQQAVAAIEALGFFE